MKPTQPKKCRVCGKNIGLNTQTGLCRHHYTLLKNEERRKKRREEHRCVDCNKEIVPVMIYPYRCSCCVDREKKRNENRNKNN
jgi:ribosomal protein S14